MLTDIDLLNLAEENLVWFSQNSGKIREKFGGKVIAIKDKNIIASSDNTKELLNSLEKMKVDDSEVLIERVPLKDEIVIL